MERSGAKDRKEMMQEFDGRLAEAAAKDLAAYFGEAMSSIAFRGKAPWRPRKSPASAGDLV